jgi:hypothetical protein
VATILYGLPAFTPELDRVLKTEEVVLGGCIVSGDAPRWQCARCEHRWGKLKQSMIYPEPKQRELNDREKAHIRARIRQGDDDIYALSKDFQCSASQIAGIKAALTKGQ